MSKPYNLKPIDKIPRASLYDEVVDAFLEMPDKIVLVEFNDDRRPYDINQSLIRRIYKRNLEKKIKCVKRKHKVYLQKLDQEEESSDE